MDFPIDSFLIVLSPIWKTGKWSLMSVTSKPWHPFSKAFASFVKILSMAVAELWVILVGRLISGKVA